MDLLIVESPTKSKTLKKFLGRGFEIMASRGHIRDLPKRELGVDIEDGFRPKYVTIVEKRKIISQLRKGATSADRVYLAPDPDREGEAIAWHIAEAIGKANSNILRATFNEITEGAVREGVAKAGRIDENKVKAQQARRILDRLVGYKVSPILWKTVHRGLSAGRVQSVALRMICEREKAIREFEPQEYWNIGADFRTDEDEIFRAKLTHIRGKLIKISNRKQAEEAVEGAKKESYSVSEVKREKKKRHPNPPFITSTLQQEASRRLGFNTKRTMMVAQQLYEGIELGEEGSVGLITYMRTDSIRISQEARQDAWGFIAQNFGNNYLTKSERKYRSRGKVQDAHEAIRPTRIDRKPEDVKRFLSKDQLELYELIWSRLVASEMSPALFENTTVSITGGEFLFRATEAKLLFDGYLRVYQESEEENGEKEEKTKLPELEVKERLNLLKLHPKQLFTKPPPRFSEASLVKELEANGIGRPSTYAQIISTLRDRRYVSMEKRRFFSTELGEVVSKIVTENFPHIFNVKFTASMEAELDKIEEGKYDWQQVLNDFYTPFSKMLRKVEANRQDIKKQIQEETNESCPDCGAPLVIKWGRNGRFISCSAYPECKFTKPLHEEEAITTEEKCEKCGSPMVVKSGRYGKFLACSAYPECKSTKPYDLGIPCPREGCEGKLTEKRSKRGRIFYGCTSYPKCDFATWDKPVPQECPSCKAKFMVSKSSKAKGEYLKCLECGHQLTSPEEVEAAV
jgi:DNA topoisomerase-1